MNGCIVETKYVFYSMLTISGADVVLWPNQVVLTHPNPDRPLVTLPFRRC